MAMGSIDRSLFRRLLGQLKEESKWVEEGEGERHGNKSWSVHL
jgi:hypothetical protein